MGLFRRKKKVTEPPINMITPPPAVKIEGVPDGFTVFGIPTEISVHHTFDKIEVTLPTEFQHLMNVSGSVSQSNSQVINSPTVEQPNVDESIRARKAEQAEKINKILETKGERIRAYRVMLHESYLKADRQRKLTEASILKAKLDVLDEIFKI